MVAFHVGKIIWKMIKRFEDLEMQSISLNFTFANRSGFSRMQNHCKVLSGTKV